MNTIIFIAAAATIAVVLALTFLKKDKGNAQGANAKQDDETGDPELYTLGLNPISDKPIMYALTTCQHCKNTRKFLEEQGIDAIIIYLDEFSGKKRTELMEKVRTYNPRGTFPVVLVPGGKVVVGYRKQLLKEALVDDAGRTA